MTNQNISPAPEGKPIATGPIANKIEALRGSVSYWERNVTSRANAYRDSLGQGVMVSASWAEETNRAAANLGKARAELAGAETIAALGKTEIAATEELRQALRDTLAELNAARTLAGEESDRREAEKTKAEAVRKDMQTQIDALISEGRRMVSERDVTIERSFSLRHAVGNGQSALAAARANLERRDATIVAVRARLAEAAAKVTEQGTKIRELEASADPLIPVVQKLRDDLHAGLLGASTWSENVLRLTELFRALDRSVASTNAKASPPAPVVIEVKDLGEALYAEVCTVAVREIEGPRAFKLGEDHAFFPKWSDLTETERHDFVCVAISFAQRLALSFRSQLASQKPNPVTINVSVAPPPRQLGAQAEPHPGYRDSAEIAEAMRQIFFGTPLR